MVTTSRACIAELKSESFRQQDSQIESGQAEGTIVRRKCRDPYKESWLPSNLGSALAATHEKVLLA